MEMGEVRICPSLSLFGLKMEGWFLNQFHAPCYCRPGCRPFFNLIMPSE